MRKGLTRFRTDMIKLSEDRLLLGTEKIRKVKKRRSHYKSFDFERV